MNYDAALAIIASFKIGTRLRHADGKAWYVRAVLPDDERFVARRWIPHRRSYWYEVRDPTALMVGLFVVDPRPRRQRA